MPVHLIRHPASDRPALAGIEVSLSWRPEGDLEVAYTVSGGLADVLVPGPVTPGRADGLWRHTCFEAFLMADSGPAYREFNFSPSGEWAAYRFAGYRDGGTDLAMADPLITCRQDADALSLTARLPAAALPAGHLRLGLSAVIEAADGRTSYWALRHPPGKPDFHHTDAFAVTLPRP